MKFIFKLNKFDFRRTTNMETDIINDNFFTEQSKKMTHLLLSQNKVDINTVVMCVKDYTKKYLHIKKSVPSMAKEYTYMMWWKTQSWYKENDDDE